MFLRMPHAGRPVLVAGAGLEQARAAMIMAHGRGASAADILTVAGALGRPDFSYLAPEAEGNAWYPHGFMSPIQQNEPWLSDALGVLDGLVARVGAAGIPPDRLLMLGFSQGACLTLEYVARHPRR